jgi:hypothetical protein
MVPQETLAALKHSAVDNQTTARSVVLNALQMAGYPVPDAELGDRRKPNPQQMSLLSEQPGGRVISITPEIARQMLDTSPGNRTLRNATVHHYSMAMKRGEWIVGQPLEFDCNGQLRNGHHRLNAVIDSGLTIDFMVVTGLPTDAFKVMDIGLTRTMSDVIGIKSYTIQEATLVCSMFSVFKPTPKQIETMCMANWTIDSNKLQQHCPTKRKILSAAPVRVSAIYWMGLKPEFSQYVLDQYRALVLMDFENLSARCKAFLRQAMSIEIGGHTGRKELLIRAIRAFDFEERDVPNISLQTQSYAKILDKFKFDGSTIFNITTENQQ